MVSPWQENGSILMCLKWLEGFLGIPVLLDVFVCPCRVCYSRLADLARVRLNRPQLACGSCMTTILSMVICTVYVTCVNVLPLKNTDRVGVS